MFSHVARATRFKLPCWHTIVKCGFIIHLIMTKTNTGWDMFVFSPLFVSLFTTVSQISFPSCVAIPNFQRATLTSSEKIGVRNHVHSDYENTNNVWHHYHKNNSQNFEKSPRPFRSQIRCRISVLQWKSSVFVRSNFNVERCGNGKYVLLCLFICALYSA
jgi:hypothetical protein